jgi:hypothetical protein
MKKLKKYTVERYDIFRGKNNPNYWFVFDTIEGRYVGGFFVTLKEAKAWVEEREQ